MDIMHACNITPFQCQEKKKKEKKAIKRLVYPNTLSHTSPQNLHHTFISNAYLSYAKKRKEREKKQSKDLYILPLAGHTFHEDLEHGVHFALVFKSTKAFTHNFSSIFMHFS
jgi:hypothetical protein